MNQLDEFLKERPSHLKSICRSPKSGNGFFFQSPEFNPKYLIKIQDLHCGEVELKNLELFEATGAQPGNLLVEAWQNEEALGIVLKNIQEHPPTQQHGHKLYHQLAKVHATKADSYGLDYHNTIGALPQKNLRTDNWAHFWVHQRLEPWYKKHATKFDLSLPKVTELLSNHTPEPSLIHGDLWNGNVLFDGQWWFIDPACYFGDPEVDLAMAQLFGGFPTTFLHAFEQRYHKHSDFLKRQQVYQLFFLLVHLELFGHSYLSPCQEIGREIENW